MDSKANLLYQPSEIESKWQDKWEEDKLYSPNLSSSSKPFYNLMMFPYPSAEGLHVGNMYAFTGADVYGRYQRMLGNDVFEPIGLDGFGIHSENYALKVGRHPKEQAAHAEQNFYRQLRSIGNSFDWQHHVETYNPDYYKWTQWIFVQLFKAGLAYRKTALVNWCPQDKTVLSDEQVIAGECERCGARVERRELEQWFFKITDYAQRLLDGVEKIDWPEKIKIAQRNWIGKSQGAEIEFKLEGLDGSISVFTTRPDTLYGATFLVIAPEHSLVSRIIAQEGGVDKEKISKIKAYLDEVRKKSDIERTAEGKEKTGVEAGVVAVNPVTNEPMPVFIADYVLGGYGTGAIMAVPAHDQRDFEFATKYNLPIMQVIEGGDIKEKAYTAGGKIINSKEWDGLEMPKSISNVINWLEEKNIGKGRINFHLRDWLISRQRYWGAPIPMVFCESCSQNGEGERNDMPGWYTVSLDQLPILLPDVEDWKPMGTGKAPLANHPEFYETTCPECNSKARRETDVCDTFLDSSWYFLRYPSTDIQNAPFDALRTNKWLPVDMYIGGAEHAVLHLLYSRFVTMVLSDLKFIEFEEPFPRLFAHGLIIKDGAKMSKSKGNVVVPDEYIVKYGADSLRTYLMFLGPYEDGGDFKDSGIEGVNKFLRRVWRLFVNVKLTEQENEEILKAVHRTIQHVESDFSKLSYNTAIARLMELYNGISGEKELSREVVSNYLRLLAPFAPHITEELWHSLLNEKTSIHTSQFPQFKEELIALDELSVVIQVNGKKRAEIIVSSQKIDEEQFIVDEAKKKVEKHLEGQTLKKAIYIKGKIVNFVI